jgi:hypothetical protein
VKHALNKYAFGVQRSTWETVMAMTLLYRLFRIGGLPKNVRTALESEGMRIIEEGIRVSVTYRDFKAPGKRFTWKRRDGSVPSP